MGKEEALGWEEERKERENQATRAVAAKGRSSSNSVSNHNTHSKVRSDGKGREGLGSQSDRAEMDVQTMDEQRLDGMKVSTSTVRWEAGIGEWEGMTHGEDMKNGRERGKRVRKARIIRMDRMEMGAHRFRAGGEGG